jgi:diguanylate cyclase (GGDEF)-like protein
VAGFRGIERSALTSRPDGERVRQQLLALLSEDALNGRRLTERLDALLRDGGGTAHATLLLILTRSSFGEEEARRHWEAIVAHQAEMRSILGRDVALRVALLDYFINRNRAEVRPTRIELQLRAEEEGPSPSDPLTGLPGDRAFRATLLSEIRRARRYGQKVAVVLFDFDGFARVNTAVGESVGDRLLRDAAILLHNKVRDIDLAARTIEDELAVVLPETDRSGALLVAERFRSEVEAYFASRDVAGARVALTLSGGIACYPEDGGTADEILERAACALYQAKAGGKNAVRTYHPEWRRYLRVELEPGRFEVEVLAPREVVAGPVLDVGGSGIVFGSFEPIFVGEEIEIRLVDADAGPGRHSPKLRGRVVRLEELPPAEDHDASGVALRDRYEIGVALDSGSGSAGQDLIEFLEQSQPRQPGAAR